MFLLLLLLLLFVCFRPVLCPKHLLTYCMTPPEGATTQQNCVLVPWASHVLCVDSPALSTAVQQHSSQIPLSNSQEEAAQERSRLSAQLRELQRVELTEFVRRRQEETNQGSLNLLDMTTKTSPDRNGYP